MRLRHFPPERLKPARQLVQVCALRHVAQPGIEPPHHAHSDWERNEPSLQDLHDVVVHVVQLVNCPEHAGGETGAPRPEHVVWSLTKNPDLQVAHPVAVWEHAWQLAMEEHAGREWADRQTLAPAVGVGEERWVARCASGGGTRRAVRRAAGTPSG